jgi:predicted GIY-YIG superfamily endonuclease
MQRGYGVYIIKAKNQPLYKIGVTYNINKRIKQLQTGCPFPIELYFLVNGFPRNIAIQTEKQLHKTMSHYRTSGEWFRLYSHSVDIIWDQLATIAQDYFKHHPFIKTETEEKKKNRKEYMRQYNIKRQKEQDEFMERYIKNHPPPELEWDLNLF